MDNGHVQGASASTPTPRPASGHFSQIALPGTLGRLLPAMRLFRAAGVVAVTGCRGNGWLEIPDYLPIIGNLDEVAATVVLLRCLGRMGWSGVARAPEVTVKPTGHSSRRWIGGAVPFS